MIALVLFLIVKTYQRAARSGEEAVVRPCPYCMTDVPVAASRCRSCTSQVEPLAT